MKKNKYIFRKKVIAAITSALYLTTFCLPDIAHGATITFSNIPLFLTTNITPNILMMYGNSNSMDEDASGAAVGSTDATSKSQIARQAILSVANSYLNKVNMGLLAYQQYTSGTNAVALNYLSNSFYDASYNPANYNASYTGDRASTTKRYRSPNPSATSNYIYYNVDLPFYSSTNQGNLFCFSYTAKAFNNGENPVTGPWDTYYCYAKKTTTTDTLPTQSQATKAPTSTGYSSYQYTSTFYPTDSDLGQGITDFGTLLVSTTVGQAWFSNASPGKGYVHIPIASLTSTQLAKFTTKLAVSQFKTNSPYGATYPLENAGLTPLQGTVETAASYFSGTLTDTTQGGPATLPAQACGKNFLVLLTDGFPSVTDAGTPSSDTTTMLNSVTTAVSNAYSGANVTTYIVGFALPFGTNPQQLDVIANAGGTGTSYYADDPTSLSQAFSTIFSNILSRTAAAASVALSSGYISSNSSVYQAKFNSSNWSGDLLSIPLSSSGQLPSNQSTINWSAATQLNNIAATSRVIETYKPSTGKGIAFEWPVNSASPTSTELDASQITALNTNMAGTVDSKGSTRLPYLRGDATNETTVFRTRGFKLGDIINSSPIYVAPPSNNYSDTGYSAFTTTYANRSPTVYVGANDGMLHGFNSSTGNEVLAYVPSEVYKNLSSLSDPTYASNHKFYVDGSPNYGDAYINSTWRTVLLSGLNAGGRGIFALDITDPTQFSEANSSKNVLFEYNSTTDTDTGYIWQQPLILKMNTGKWAAVFGNGVDSTGTGLSTLFVVDLATGTLVKKISVGTGSVSAPGGITGIAAVDKDGNGTADYVYATDINGYVWKFDLSSSSTANWGNYYGTKALFSAGQPITITPQVSVSPNGGYLIYFGTGKYLENGDNTTTAQNAFYGIRDPDVATATMPITTSTLQQQTISTTTVGTTVYRTMSSNAVNYTTQNGWYVNLPLSGERVVTNPVLRNGRIIFTTLVPSTATCSYGGTSWLMEFNYLTGGQLTTQAFDTNGDGTINSSDTIVAGVQLGSIASAPTVLQGLGTSTNPLENKFINQSSGTVTSVLESGSTQSDRRSAWREIVKTLF